MSRIVLFLLSTLGTTIVHAQSIEDMSFYADVMVNAVEAKHRTRASEQFNVLFDEYIRSASFDAEALKEVKYISQQRTENAPFYIYTWQLKESENSYQSFGYIKMDSGEVFKLKPGKHEEVDMAYSFYGKDDWLGVLYYKIMPTTVEGKDAWLLFGYDGHSKFEHRKVLDVLRFDEANQPIFGAEIFKKEVKGSRDNTMNRLVLTYSMDSNVTLNYNPNLNIIMHDHLINRMGRIPGQGETWLSDGSYEGYKWDGSMWVYDEKVFEQVLEEGKYPRPVPVLDIRKEGRGK